MPSRHHRHRLHENSLAPGETEVARHDQTLLASVRSSYVPEKLIELSGPQEQRKKEPQD